MSRPKVYLAGGLVSGWQQAVKQDVKGCEFFDPSTTQLTSPAAWTTWDLLHVETCDVVFAYSELSNPRPYGMALEIGYGLALKKRVILVDEWWDTARDRHLLMARMAVHEVYHTLEEGIASLQKLARERVYEDRCTNCRHPLDVTSVWVDGNGFCDNLCADSYQERVNKALWPDD